MQVQHPVGDTMSKVNIKQKGEVVIREAIDANAAFVKVYSHLANPLIEQPTIVADIILAQLLYVSK